MNDKLTRSDLRRLEARVRFLEQISFPRTLKLEPLVDEIDGESGGELADYPFLCLCTTDGGSAGGGGGDCSFTYVVSKLDGVTKLGENMEPVKPRMEGVQYVEPAADSLGLGYYDDGTFTLIEVYAEIPDMDETELTPCEEPGLS
jgi:hypothetical protein